MSSAPLAAHTEAGRIPALDGLRGIAILLVLTQHYFLGLLPSTDIWIDRVTRNGLAIGWTGVDLFFVLSGFLITGILLDAKAGRGSYFRSFYARRFLRIFPAYYVFLFFLFVMLPNFNSLGDRPDFRALFDDQLWFWTYTNNISGAIDPFVHYGPFGQGHLWSLAVEEQFYLVWPIVVLALGRRTLLATCAIMIVTAFLFRLAIHQDMMGTISHPIAAHGLAPARMDALAIGALIAVVARDPAQLRLLVRAAPVIAAVAVAAIITIVVATGSGTLRAFDFWTGTVGLSMVAMLYGALVVKTIAAPPGALLHRIGMLSVLQTFGKYSYAMYIVHVLLLQLLLHRIAEAGGMPLVLGMELPGRLFLLFVGASMSLAVAWASWHLYEKHFLKLKRFFPYGASTARDGQPARGERPVAMGSGTPLAVDPERRAGVAPARFR